MVHKRFGVLTTLTFRGKHLCNLAGILSVQAILNIGFHYHQQLVFVYSKMERWRTFAVKDVRLDPLQPDGERPRDPYRVLVTAGR